VFYFTLYHNTYCVWCYNNKILAIFEVLKVVILKVQVFWYVMFCLNANSSLGNYSHYDRASHPTRQDSSEIIPVRQKLKTFSLTVREKCRLKALRSRLRKRRARADEMEREGERHRDTVREREREK